MNYKLMMEDKINAKMLLKQLVIFKKQNQGFINSCITAEDNLGADEVISILFSNFMLNKESNKKDPKHICKEQTTEVKILAVIKLHNEFHAILNNGEVPIGSLIKYGWKTCTNGVPLLESWIYKITHKLNPYQCALVEEDTFKIVSKDN